MTERGARHHARSFLIPYSSSLLIVPLKFSKIIFPTNNSHSIIYKKNGSSKKFFSKKNKKQAALGEGPGVIQMSYKHITDHLTTLTMTATFTYTLVLAAIYIVRKVGVLKTQNA